MELIRTVQAMQAKADARRQAGRCLALVPTMGALHEGHLALVDEARRQADHVTVSIFVNPTQFGPGEDFDTYPRLLERDLERLRERGGVDAVFAPSVEEMYPAGDNLTWVEVGRLGDHLCGAQRPDHFRGVTTIVARLFNACKPHLAVFGLKDGQQFLILRRMVRDLCFDVEMVGVPTVREADGLALSSRNAYLSPTHRKQAVVLSEAVEVARRRIAEGEQRGTLLVEAMREKLAQAPAARVQYAEVVETETLQPVEHLAPGQEVMAAVAVFFGEARLIDNARALVPAPPT